MIDGDDHEEDRRDPEDRTEEGAPPAEESRTDAGDTTVADSPVDAEGHDGSEPTPEPQGPAEEQPAMDLEGGSDEGGTVAEASEDSTASDELETSGEPESLDEDGEFDGAALDEDDHEHAFEGEDLGLVSDDDALPWLESSDYEEIESVDAWRITGFVVLGLVVLALLVGGIWYFTSRTGEGTPIADGSTIEAPEGPYKERPEDPGGKTFARAGRQAASKHCAEARSRAERVECAGQPHRGAGWRLSRRSDRRKWVAPALSPDRCAFWREIPDREGRGGYRHRLPIAGLAGRHGRRTPAERCSQG